MLKKIIDYLKYSGVCVTIAVNPYHWSWIPVFAYEGSNEIWFQDTFRFSVLFLTIRCWVDNGEW